MNKSSELLFYKTQAQNFNEALPLGNGRIGAMVYGGAVREKLSLNEDTLWSGAPRVSEREGMAEVFENIRHSAEKGDMRSAERLASDAFGDYLVQMYLPLCDLLIDFPQGRVSDYQRQLNLANALHTVTYTFGGQTVTRETFISAPHGLLVMRFSSENRQALSCRFSVAPALKAEIADGGSALVLTGRCPICRAPFGQTHAAEDKKIYSDGEGIPYAAVLQVFADTGVSVSGHTVSVCGAGEITAVFAVRTGFCGYDRPFSEKDGLTEVCRQDIERFARDGYDRVKELHIQDYAGLYGRTALELEPGAIASLPTDERLRRHADGETDNALYALLFNYGRYLMLSGSRKGTQPMNLQGIWNDKPSPPWSSNYTLNINTEMNYWPALRTGLEECLLPLIEMAEELCETGKRAARQYYGAPGSVAHHATDLWRTAHPSNNLLPDSAKWSFWNLSLGWLSSFLMEYYSYTGDAAMLKRAYRLLESCAAFYLFLLTEDGEGRLILSPSTSPENSYVYTDEKPCAVSRTAAMTMAIVREVFTNLVKAVRLLGITSPTADQVLQKLPLLKGYAVASDGRIEEWDAERREFEPHHRHLSYLYGLYPGKEITPDRTPALAAACESSLEGRGDEGTGWSLAWKVCLWARLRNGERALRLIDRQLCPVDSLCEGHDAGGGTYINLFCAHPPFQIDGNFGVTAGICEMLIWNEGNAVRPLPALPAGWKNGSVCGLWLHGGKAADIVWKNGRLESIRIEDSILRAEDIPETGAWLCGYQILY